MAQHFYSTQPADTVIAEYAFEIVACHVYQNAAPGTVPMYRWFNPATGDHLYTLDPTGELAPTSGFNPEGPVFHVFRESQPNTSPFYRWSKSGDHFYTLDPTGELAPVGGYTPEGISCYVYPSPAPGTVPLNRWVTTLENWCAEMLARDGTFLTRFPITANSRNEAVTKAKALQAQGGYPGLHLRPGKC